jgi:hypothetical protein
VFCLDKAVGYLINEPIPTAHLADVGERGGVRDSPNVLVRRLDPLRGDLEPCKLHGLLGELELFRREHHSILVAVG